MKYRMQKYTQDLEAKFNAPSAVVTPNSIRNVPREKIIDFDTEDEAFMEKFNKVVSDDDLPREGDR